MTDWSALETILRNSKPTMAEAYLAKSGLQKCIRRGMPDDAVAMAVLMRDFGWSGAVLNRLCVVLCEDIGLANIQLCMALVDRLVSKPGWDEVESIIRQMASSVKNRDADDGANFVQYAMKIGSHSAPDTIEVDEYAKLISLGLMLPDEKVGWSLLSGATGEAFDFIHQMKRISDKAKIHARLVSAFAVLRTVDGRVARPSGVKSMVPGKKEVFPGRGIPMCAMDGHTFYGGVIARRVAKITGVAPDEIGFMVFLHEGAILDQWVCWENDYRSLVPAFMEKEGSKGMSAALVECFDSFRMNYWMMIVKRSVCGGAE